MAIHCIDIFDDTIPKYVPFHCKLEFKYENAEPFISELLIRTREKQPISLKTKEPYIIGLNSTQTLSLIPHYDEVMSSDIDDLIDEMEYCGPINLLTDGVMVFFTSEYSRKPHKYTTQVLKKLGDDWYSYDVDSDMWVIINIKTNILSINLSSLTHRYVCIEDLS